MANSLVSTVLEIERDAESILAKAGLDAEKIIANATTQREDAKRSAENAVLKDVALLEEKAAAEKAIKVRELTATGESALAAVRSISDAAFTGAVRHVIKQLSGE